MVKKLCMSKILVVVASVAVSFCQAYDNDSAQKHMKILERIEKEEKRRPQKSKEEEEAGIVQSEKILTEALLWANEQKKKKNTEKPLKIAQALSHSDVAAAYQELKVAVRAHEKSLKGEIGEKGLYIGGHQNRLEEAIKKIESLLPKDVADLLILQAYDEVRSLSDQYGD